MKYDHHIALSQVTTQGAQKEAPLGLLKLMMDALPGSVYLVRGDDARLILANRTAARLWGASWFPGQPIGEFLTRNRIREQHQGRIWFESVEGQGSTFFIALPRGLKDKSPGEEGL